MPAEIGEVAVNGELAERGPYRVGDELTLGNGSSATVVGIVVVGRAILAALRRVKPVSGGISKDRAREVQSPESSSNGTRHQLTS